MEKEWDVFISYASEDRETVVEPLVRILLSLGLTVWYDQTALRAGASLRKSIDEGLCCCRYGVVVLSPHYLGKHFPERELDGLTEREVDGEPVIIPLWYDLSAAEVRKYSPSLADRVAARWEDGEKTVAWKIFEVVRSELVEGALQELAEHPVPHEQLPELLSGEQIFEMLRGAALFFYGHEELQGKEDAKLVADFVQAVQDHVDLSGPGMLGVADQVKAEYEFTEWLRELHDAGWKVFGHRSLKLLKLGETAERLPVASFVVARSDTKDVSSFPNGRFVLFRPPQRNRRTRN